MTPISNELREFVAAKIGSLEQLDVFALLYAQRERDWSPADVARELDAAPAAAGMRLYLLESAGLLTSNGEKDVRYRYASNPVIDDFAAELLLAYRADKTILQSIISGSTPVDPVKQLADAFRLRK